MAGDSARQPAEGCWIGAARDALPVAAGAGRQGASCSSACRHWRRIMRSRSVVMFSVDTTGSHLRHCSLQCSASGGKTVTLLHAQRLYPALRVRQNEKSAA